VTGRILVGISACLVGEQTRYDGGHKLDRQLVATLTPLFKLLPVCPEVECGLTVPREPMRLAGDPAAPRLVTIETGHDLTGQMSNWCRRKVTELEHARISGFILKRNSPSCGLAGVPVHNSSATGQGLFAAALAEHFPHLPMEEAERLTDPALLETFIQRLFAIRR